MANDILIDGLSQIFRSYYARSRVCPALPVNRRGHLCVFQHPPPAYREHKPDYLAMVMEGGDEAMSSEADRSEYKANREPRRDSNLRFSDSQILRATERARSERCRGSRPTSLATLCTALAGQDLEIVIVSLDKDLINSSPTSPDVRPDEERVRRSPGDRIPEGYRPDQAIEVRRFPATTPTTSGGHGVGPRRRPSCHEYGSADAVIEHANELTPALRKKRLDFGPRIDITPNW